MGYMNFQTEKTGKAIQIQSVTYDGNVTATNDKFTIYVQNVGESDVKLTSVFINGALASSITYNPAGGNLDQSATATVTGQSTGLSNGVQQITIKVTTEDGTFSEITKQFTIEDTITTP
jgi:hypothetical protein